MAFSAEDSASLAGALRAMVRTYEAHGHAEAAARLRGALDDVLAGTADPAALNAMLQPKALPRASVYPYDRASQQIFYDAWDAALALTDQGRTAQGQT